MRGGTGNHEGNVFFGNQPVCDKGWDIHDATVACNMLGWVDTYIRCLIFLLSSSRFHGAYSATRSSKFGVVPENFIIGNLNCYGNES